MAAIKIFLCGILALVVTGCGHIVTEGPLTPRSRSVGVGSSPDKTIVVLPFADYSYVEDVKAASMRNLAVMESLTDTLTSRGFMVPVQEDVFGYLVDNRIIEAVSPQNKRQWAELSDLGKELEWGWSDRMNDEIKGLINQQKRRNYPRLVSVNNPMKGPNMHNRMDKKMITRIGRDFEADYVLRGRIIEYSLRQENIWCPARQGVLPFIYRTATRLIFGIAKSDDYDLIGNIGDVYGDTPQAVVHLRIWVQDTETGKVIWTNRSEVAAAPRSIYADREAVTLFDISVRKAVSGLMDDFYNNI